MGITSKVINPQAAVIVWNYRDRVNADGAFDPHKVEQVIVSTSSLIGISTSKTKSAPSGTFELTLAPTHNWVSRLTPGSWCVILMSQNKNIPNMSSDDIGTADKDLVKMLGRIDAVRTVVDVDPETGARKTSYIVTGEDWGCVFNSILYIDPIMRNNLLEIEGAIGQAARIVFNNMLLDWVYNNKVKLPTPTQVIDAIKELWGAPLSDVTGAIDSYLAKAKDIKGNPLVVSPLTFTSTSQFQLPQEVANYFSFGNTLFKTPVQFSELIEQFSGRLSGYDEYSGDQEEAYGIPEPTKFYGSNTFWQLIVENSNTVLNEVVNDIRWEDDIPYLALYNRTRPFINRSKFEGSTKEQVKKNLSRFENVRRITIPLEDVIALNAGTNFRDKSNFVEIRLAPQLVKENFEAQIKKDAQTTDRDAYERDGFKPTFQIANYLPYKNGQVGVAAPLEATQWKYLVREWHFNTHLMLNGAVTFIGQNTYIQVGDNIMIDSRVLGGPTNQYEAENGGGFLLAHVESIHHQFSVAPDTGARHFVTTVKFVRGIISDENGKMLGTSSFSLGDAASIAGVDDLGKNDPIDAALDKKAQKVQEGSNIVSSSTTMDPNNGGR